MKLKSLRINNMTFSFTKKINIFLGEKNSGKTTIFHLLKFIYGANYSPKKPLGKAFETIASNHTNYIISWIFEGDDEKPYSLNLSTKKIMLPTQKEICISKYSEHINQKFSYYNSVFNTNIKSVECFSYNEDITQTLNTKADYAKFFRDKEDMSYTALCFLRLIQENDLASIFQNYFSLYGKKKNLEKSINISKKIKKDISNDLIELVKDDTHQHIFQRYVELVKINKSEFDETLFAELETICQNIPNFNITKVRTFHENLVNSYNDVITEEKKKLKQEYKILNNHNKSELNLVLSHTKLIEQTQVQIDELDIHLKERNFELEKKETDLLNLSADLNSFCTTFNNDFNVIKEFNNRIELRGDKNKKTNLVLNLQNSTQDNTNAGGSDTVTNFIGFLTYTLIKSNFPMLLFEKTFLTENQNKTIILLLNKIATLIDNSKRVFVTLHPDEELKDKSEYKNDEVEIFTCSKNFFGLNF